MNGLQMQMELRPCLVYTKYGDRKALFHCWSMKCGVEPLTENASGSLLES